MRGRGLFCQVGGWMQVGIAKEVSSIVLQSTVVHDRLSQATSWLLQFEYLQPSICCSLYQRKIAITVFCVAVFRCFKQQLLLGCKVTSANARHLLHHPVFDLHMVLTRCVLSYLRLAHLRPHNTASHHTPCNAQSAGYHEGPASFSHFQPTICCPRQCGEHQVPRAW